MQENTTSEALPSNDGESSNIDASLTPTNGLESGPETVPTVEELLAAAEAKAAESQDAFLRAKAETENMRRRAQEDIAKAGKYASERFATELLPVKDSLEAALSNENQSAENLKAGVELTLRQLSAAFEKSNLGEINPIGEKFDPHKHQAISQVESADETTEPNTVMTVLQKGYSLNDRVIRPALVIVSKAKST